VSYKYDEIRYETITLTKKNPLSECRVARSKDLIAVLVISSRLGSLELSRSSCDRTRIRKYIPADERTTCLITHVISCEKTEVRLSSTFRITTLKLVKLGTVCEGIVAVLSRKCKDVNVIGSAGAFRSVRKKESRTTPKEDVNDRAKWGSANKMFGDD